MISQNSKLNNLQKRVYEASSIVSLTDDELEHKELMKSSFKDFVISAWPYVDPQPYLDNWHIDALCEHFEALYHCDIRRLIVNIPPRCSKTLIGCVMLPAWAWLQNPAMKYIYASNIIGISEASSTKCRDLILSPWFKHFFRDEFKLRKDDCGKRKFSNNKMGERRSTAIRSSIISHGCDLLFLDDPNDSTAVYGEADRTAAKTFLDSAATSRINNEKTFRLCIMQQRLHWEDLTGHYLNKELPNVVHLYLPMEYESTRKCKTTFGNKTWQDPREKDGELLVPERFSKEWVDVTKKDMGSHIYAGQHQQRPAPTEGMVFRDHWFVEYSNTQAPQFTYILQSWDTALVGHDKRAEKIDPCYSACTTWGIFEDDNGIPNIMLLNVWRGKVEFPDLRKMAYRMALNYHDTDLNNPLNSMSGFAPDVILIEAKVSGFSLYDELRRLGIPVVKFNPNRYGNKHYRARSVSALVEAGRVWLPTKPPKHEKLRNYAQTFLDICITFPSDQSNDVVDSMSQALIKIREDGFIKMPLDHIYEEPIDYFRDEPLY